MDGLKKLLAGETSYRLADDIMDKFLSAGEEMRLKGGDILVNAGEFDPNIYVVKSGIIRFSDMNGESERTFAFGSAGTMFVSKHSFVKRLPSYYQIDACCDTTLLRIPNKHYWYMVENYNEFAQWALWMVYEELFFQEKKNQVINGSAKDRYMSLLHSRMDLVTNVPQKILASYLNVTPQYLCRLKKMLEK